MDYAFFTSRLHAGLFTRFGHDPNIKKGVKLMREEHDDLMVGHSSEAMQACCTTNAEAIW